MKITPPVRCWVCPEPVPGEIFGLTERASVMFSTDSAGRTWIDVFSGGDHRVIDGSALRQAAY